MQKQNQQNQSQGDVSTKHSSSERVESLLSPEQGLQPTQRPWELREQGLIVSAVGNVRFIARVESHSPRLDHELTNEDQANAELIVRAVNSHDALVKAVRFALTTPGLIKGRDELAAALVLAEKPDTGAESRG